MLMMMKTGGVEADDLKGEEEEEVPKFRGRSYAQRRKQIASA